MEDEPSKDFWDKLRIGTGVAGTILIPVVIAFVTWQVNSGLKERDAQIRMVELAVGILQQEPNPETGTGLREWAVSVIDEQSGVKLSPAAKSALLNEQLTSDWNWSSHGAPISLEKWRALVEPYRDYRPPPETPPEE